MFKSIIDAHGYSFEAKLAAITAAYEEGRYIFEMSELQ